jgi:hypothetical protein
MYNSTQAAYMTFKSTKSMTAYSTTGKPAMQRKQTIQGKTLSVKTSVKSVALQDRLMPARHHRHQSNQINSFIQFIGEF